jgi:acylpyruvate hydrolase
MRFVTFKRSGELCVGVVSGDDIVDLSAIAPEAPKSLKAVIASGIPADLASKVEAAPARARIPLAGAPLAAPIPDPGKLMCVGLNYHDHAEETGQAVPNYPPLFLRAISSMAGPGEPMIVPKVSEQLDFEAELTVVIGKRCRHVSEAEALDYVFGYTCFNEGSVRDYQKHTSQWTSAKNFDRTAPLGPWIVTADEVPPGAHGIQVRTLLNGKVMQDANTDGMIFGVAKIISYISQIMTLEPGDLIPTGTPAGVGMGRTPPVWLKPGDTVTIDIESVGALTNPVAAES